MPLFTVKDIRPLVFAWIRVRNLAVMLFGQHYRYTLGFVDPVKLRRHHQKHGHKFGSPLEGQYEEWADAFVGGPKDLFTLECERSVSGDIIRYNPITEEFGVRRSNGHIKTYFIVELDEHPYGSNMEHFEGECAQP